MNRALVPVTALVACAGLGSPACDRLGLDGDPRRRPTAELREDLARGYEEDHRIDTETVRSYRAWHARIRELDLPVMGLPPAGDADDAFRPVAGDPTFCARLPEQDIPDPESMVAEYRRHAMDYRASRPPADFASYRAEYLAECHLARLACLARAGGPEHRSAFVGLLDEHVTAVRYTAAVHAINHDLAPDAARAVLRAIANDGSDYFNHAAHTALLADTPPIGLYFDPNRPLDRAVDRLRGSRQRRTHPRHGGRFRFW